MWNVKTKTLISWLKYFHYGYNIGTSNIIDTNRHIKVSFKKYVAKKIIIVELKIRIIKKIYLLSILSCFQGLLKLINQVPI